MQSPSSSSSSSSSSSTRSSPVHQASQVDPASHSPALLQLIDIKLSKPVIEYVVDCVSETVDYAMGRPPTPPSRRSVAHFNKLSSFTNFVTNVITRAEVSTPAILASLVYIDRAKPHLHIALEEWALERVFLGALMVASKYLNDSTLKNVHWALCTGVFGKRDVGRIEREFLDVLDFELRIAEDDILSHHAGLLAIGDPSAQSQQQLNHVSQLHSQYLVPPPNAHSHQRRHSHSQPRSQPQLQLHTQSHPHSQPQPYPSHHHHGSSGGVPALTPSSPESSSGSSSPCTPPAFDTATAPAPTAQSPSSKKRLHVSTFDLLRAFPIPRPMKSHKHNNTADRPPMVPPHPRVFT